MPVPSDVGTQHGESLVSNGILWLFFCRWQVESDGTETVLQTTSESKKKSHKHYREDNPSDSMDRKVHKVQKTSDETSDQRRGPMKAADLDPVTKKLFNIAVPAFHSLICMKAPFPKSELEETYLAQDAWKLACDEKKIQRPLVKGVVSLVCRCYHICNYTNRLTCRTLITASQTHFTGLWWTENKNPRPHWPVFWLPGKWHKGSHQTQLRPGWTP